MDLVQKCQPHGPNSAKTHLPTLLHRGDEIEPRSAFAASLAAEPDLPHALYREDDKGTHFLIARFATQAKAEAKAAELARGGHKQHYFVQRLRPE